jgi:hypothetical protein
MSAKECPVIWACEHVRRSERSVVLVLAQTLGEESAWPDEWHFCALCEGNALLDLARAAKIHR